MPTHYAHFPGRFNEEDRRLQLTAVTDPPWRRQWYMHDPRYGTDAEVAWRYTQGDGAVVVVVDSGIVSHREFEGRLLPGYDFLSDAQEARDGDERDADPTDEGDWRDPGECGSLVAHPSSWHGTHVAGLAVARGDNSYGVVGVAPGAMLLPVSVPRACAVPGHPTWSMPSPGRRVGTWRVLGRAAGRCDQSQPGWSRCMW